MTDNTTETIKPEFSFSTRKASTQSATYEFGLPLKKGECHSINELVIFDIQGNQYNAHFSVKSLWPDKSLKWVAVTSFLQTDHHYLVRITKKDLSQNLPDGLSTTAPIESTLTIDGSSIRCLATGLVFSLDYQQQQSSDCPFQLLDHECRTQGQYESLKIEIAVSSRADIIVVLSVGFSHASGEHNISLRIENRRAAIHEQGTWDLGDLNSEIIDQLYLNVNYDTAVTNELYLKDDGTDSINSIAVNDLFLIQFSSGGKNWKSPAHVNANGVVPISQNGFHISQDGKKVSQGLRAKPVFKLSSESSAYWLCPTDFWQNFPATIKATKTSLAWGLFPETTELQPGESKSWQLKIIPQELSHDQVTFPSADEFQVQLNPNYLNNCGVFPSVHFSAGNLFGDLIQQGITGKNSFLEKREVCDEYGWRNFGELYADHETLNQPKEPIFISHYNNQYDTILGTTVQMLCRPDSDWQEVANPLVRHTSDIDIYNTDNDKPEYNGGLFWHTDHYLPAETSTHRTYSKNHTSVYDGHQGGGGPGGQHCYTSGLLMRALIDNDPIASAKVLQLTDWIRRFYNGNNSLLGRVHRFLTIDLKPNQLTNVGIVYSGYKYPLDRGTGNYINALIDSYELTMNNELLAEVAIVVKQTIGLGDSLDSRQLDNVENSWFYTVFLQALIKYLLLKESLEQNDQDYAYVRAVLAKFGKWMLKYEEPYLTHPEKLEFPNDTWAAQDIRKAVIFSYLAYFESENRLAYREKANFFITYVTEKLTISSETSTTRILAILMQNYGLIERANLLGSCAVIPVPLSHRDLRYIGSPALIRLTKDILSIIIRFSFKAEWQWLRSRLGTPVVKRGHRDD